MAETTPMAGITVHYWAGAKAAAGVATERFEATSVASALQLARNRRSDPHFDRVLSMSSVLVDGLVTRPEELDRPVAAEVRVEILPPFAGGADGRHAVRQLCAAVSPDERRYHQSRRTGDS